ncbi:TetR/AcrR family transcriptional regulator [Cryptosporangium aurantiacum]|uniref:Transcriptional regulator, TetR family n=1 Tax=Cryptosporangium aurantiacum TaxID=134849 RepID=A0A1M7RN13_9ACTN|nr:TetR/AcrR family transcriptional regulator [Cryptosporangium aurantiacum]SHN47456.1 transcriptional regulator, TetR family [Cryptosporangium aurantiacum]
MPHVDIAQRRRDEIVRASLEIFAERGYHATGIADIASALNIGHGTFYRYFRNKRDIVSHVLVHVLERLNDTIRDENPGSADTLEECLAQFVRVGEKLFAVFTEEPALGRFFFAEALGVDRDFTRALTAGLNTFGGVTQSYLVNGVAKGFLRDDLDVGVTARAINGMILAAAIDAFDGKDPDVVRTRWLTSAPDLILRGIRA